MALATSLGFLLPDLLFSQCVVFAATVNVLLGGVHGTVVHDPGGIVPISLAVLATVIVAVHPTQHRPEPKAHQPPRLGWGSLLGKEGTLDMGRGGLMPTQLTIHQGDVQASANVVFHAAHEAGKERREQ